MYSVIDRLFPLFVKESEEYNEEKASKLAEQSNIQHTGYDDELFPIRNSLKYITLNQNEINRRLNSLKDLCEEDITKNIDDVKSTLLTTIEKLQNKVTVMEKVIEKNTDDLHNRTIYEEGFMKQAYSTNLRIEKLECIIETLIYKMNPRQNDNNIDLVDMLGRNKVQEFNDQSDNYTLLRHMCMNEA